MFSLRSNRCVRKRERLGQKLDRFSLDMLEDLIIRQDYLDVLSGCLSSTIQNIKKDVSVSTINRVFSYISSPVIFIRPMTSNFFSLFTSVVQITIT